MLSTLLWEGLRGSLVGSEGATTHPEEAKGGSRRHEGDGGGARFPLRGVAGCESRNVVAVWQCLILRNDVAIGRHFTIEAGSISSGRGTERDGPIRAGDCIAKTKSAVTNAASALLIGRTGLAVCAQTCAGSTLTETTLALAVCRTGSPGSAGNETETILAEPTRTLGVCVTVLRRNTLGTKFARHARSSSATRIRRHVSGGHSAVSSSGSLRGWIR